jgi:hypothetical protein
LASSRLNNALGYIANPLPYLIAIHNPDGIHREIKRILDFRETRRGIRARFQQH